MKYLDKSFTMPPFEPQDKMCCERCVFGRGRHAPFCEAPNGTTVPQPRHVADTPRTRQTPVKTGDLQA